MSITTWILIGLCALPAAALCIIAGCAIIGWSKTLGSDRDEPNENDIETEEIELPAIDITQLTKQQQVAMANPWEVGKRVSPHLYVNSDDYVDGKLKGQFRVALVISRHMDNKKPTWMATGTYRSEKNRQTIVKPSKRAYLILEKKTPHALRGVGTGVPRFMVVQGRMAVQFYKPLSEDELEYFYEQHPEWKDADVT